jgi:hypothetical protein
VAGTDVGFDAGLLDCAPIGVPPRSLDFMVLGAGDEIGLFSMVGRPPTELRDPPP